MRSQKGNAALFALVMTALVVGGGLFGNFAYQHYTSEHEKVVLASDEYTIDAVRPDGSEYTIIATRPNGVSTNALDIRHLAETVKKLETLFIEDQVALGGGAPEEAYIAGMANRLDARLSRETGDQLGATNKIPDLRALFETSLASKITSSASSMTLVSGTDKNGNTLASSTYAFIIDEGTSNEEFVIADCTNTACTNMQRGLSVFTGTTTVATLQKSHGRGASVKITDAPSLLIINRLIQGIETFPNALYYQSLSTAQQAALTNRKFIPTGEYVDFVGSSGCANASESARGCVELATQLESASSTVTGSTGATLVQQSQYATSSPGTAGLWDVWTNNAGKIAQSFLDWTQTIAFSGNNTHSGNETFTGETTLATTTIQGVIVEPKFGGTGSDGALAISSGVTTIDLGNASVYTLNYTTLSITGTGQLAFSNPASTGSLVIIKVKGATTITCSSAPCIDLRGIGAAAATQVDFVYDTTSHAGVAGADGSAGGAGGSAGAVWDAITKTWHFTNTVDKLIRQGYGKYMIPGAGGYAGGKGNGGTTNTGGAGGRGGGALYMEVGGAWNFTTAGGIRISGADGSNGSSDGDNAGGGGGAGGNVGHLLVLYNTLTANSGTVTAAGGNGGSGATAGTGNAGGSDLTGGGGGSSSGGYDAGAAGGNGGNGSDGVAGTNGTNGSGGSGGGGGTGNDNATGANGGAASTGGSSTLHHLITSNLWFF